MEEKRTQEGPQVSVIIPVYNVEAYLRRCLDSVLAQTIPDWECVCVDDGSTDGGGAILDEYAARDPRFVVIHKENGGLSSARNAGQDVARGEYIGFVDPDDWIEPNTYELALGAARRTGADIVQWSAIAEREDGPVPPKEREEGFFDPLEEGSVVVWNKLFRRGFLLENGIASPLIQPSEDVVFSAMAYALAQKCYRLNESLYHYDTTRESSITHLARRESDEEKNRHAVEFAEEMGKACGHAAARLKPERKAEAAEFLFKKKLQAKSQFILGLKPPDFGLFRSCIPDANRPLYLLRLICKLRAPGLAIQLFAVLRLDAPARFLIWLRKKVRGGS